MQMSWSSAVDGRRSGIESSWLSRRGEEIVAVSFLHVCSFRVRDDQSGVIVMKKHRWRKSCHEGGWWIHIPNSMEQIKTGSRDGSQGT